MKRLLHILLLLCALGFAHEASAQYYTWGSDPAGLKWSTIRTPDVRMIYPDTVSAVARRTLFYIRTVRPDIAFGFRHGPMRIPFVMHPENFQSNGLVMYLPKRVEFLTSPAIDGYSMPWYKQLVAHEYRHAVQYNNLDRGVIRALSYILGQQGSTIGLLCMPIWAMEGDAVMSETAMSSFGRGLQPSFSLGYRAMGRVGRDRKDTRDRRNIDKWFCGSYRDYIPDHYELGYQICSYAYDRYGEVVWDKVARYGSRNPYVLATTRVALEKYYDTNVSRLFRETFDVLERHWESLPQVEDSAEPLTPMPAGNYTTYQWPLPLDAASALALKTDYDRPSRFVRLDTRTGEEEVICYTGAVSTRPAMAGGRVWWTEYRRSKLFEQRVNSQLCYMDLADGTPRMVVGRRNALYPTPSEDAVAWVEYNPDGRYTVVVQGKEGAEKRFATPDRSEIHGLAWDDATRGYYVIVTDDSGMWIGRRRRASRYRRRLHYAEQPPRGRRQALFRLDRFGPGRSPLFRPEDPPRIPHHDVGLRIVHAGAVARRRGAGTGAADRLRQARLPCGGAGRRCRRADPGRAFETAAQRRESRPQAVGRREPRYGAFLGSRFAASGGGVPREAIPQGAQSGECP